MENERDCEKIYSLLHKKLKRLESRIDPDVLQSCVSEASPTYNVDPEEIYNEFGHVPGKMYDEFDFIDKLIAAEMSSALTQDPDRAKTRHLGKMFRKVQCLKTTCRAFENPWRTSSGFESSEPALCAYSNSNENYDYGGSELYSYDVQDECGRFSMEGFKMYDNPEFVPREDYQDGEVEFEGADVYGMYIEDQEEELTVREDQEEEETVRNDSEMEEECISDDQNEVAEYEGAKVVRVCDPKEEKTMTPETSSDDDSDDNDAKTHCCYRVVFWGILIGVGIISVMVGFSGFPDNSSVVSITPT